VFSIQNVALAAGELLTIALHPTEVPIGAAVSATMPLDACPANVDSGVSVVAHSWPAGSGFMTCLPPDASGRIALPSSNTRSYHLAFALRARAPGTVRSVVINYSYEDLFLEVVPPPGRADGMTVSFTPRSSTVAVDANLLPNFGPVSGVRLSLDQQGQALTLTGRCSFPSEFSSCFVGVRPHQPVVVAARGNPPHNDTWALSLNWLP
jgi:hypothetical protein